MVLPIVPYAISLTLGVIDGLTFASVLVLGYALVRS